MKPGRTTIALSMAHIACAIAYAAALAFAFFDLRISAAILSLFLALCMAAPLFPGFGFYLPIVSRGPGSMRKVALTFDDGPDPDVTPGLLSILRSHGLRAAFFVSGMKLQEFPGMVREILAQGHSIGNHSYSHSPALMFRTAKKLHFEVSAAQSIFADFGIYPFAFRPPAGITNPKLWPVLRRLGLFCCNFSCRAGDRGNRRINNLASTILRKVRPGDIVLLHDCRPPDPGDIPYLLDQFERIITGIEARGLAIVSLDELIGRPVMRKLEGGEKP